MGGSGRLRSAFDRASSLYDEVRPGYPDELFEDVVSLSGVPPGARILEVGCGTGQATLPLARRGYGLLCVELGENLAASARHNLAAYPRVEVRTGEFEETPLPEGSFDLLVSATAFHWLDPAAAYPKAARSLRPGGPSPCSGTSTWAPTRTGVSSRRRRRSTRARRPRSSTASTVGLPVRRSCRTGAKRSSARGFSAPSCGAPTSGRRHKTPGATCAYWIRTRGTSPSGRRPGRASRPASRV